MDFPRAFFFLSLLLAVYLALQGYLLIRLRAYLWEQVRDPGRRNFLYCLAAGFFLMTLYPVMRRAFYGLDVYEPYPLILRGFVAFWSFGSTGAALILLGYGFLRRLGRLFHSPTVPAPPLDPSRRDFLKRGVAMAAVAPFAVSGYGVILGARRFDVEHFSLPLKGLSSSLSQLTIAQLTDIHVGPFMPKEELLAYVEAVNRLQPDVVALTGDFIAANPSEVIPCVEALGELKARHGIFACLGNHDFFAGAANELTRLMEQKGIRVLRNDAVSIPIGNSSFELLGIDDLRWGNPDFDRALRMAQGEAGEFRLLLSHRPEAFPEAAQKGIDIVLSGHYHGGQIKLTPGPGSPSIASLMTPYAEGLYHLRRSRTAQKNARDSLLFVSRGIGITGLPIRINCSPQVAHLILTKA